MLVTLWRHGEAGYASLDAQRELRPRSSIGMSVNNPGWISLRSAYTVL
jgi:hypothetical protein